MPDSSDSQLYFEIVEKTQHQQSLADIGLDGVDLLEVLSQFDLYGAWRAELDTGLVFWTRDVFAIHEMPFAEGPVDIKKAINAYHPQDREIVSNCIEEASRRKSGFRFVLRLRKADGTYKLVKSNGRYRVTEGGREEIYGTFSQFQERVRSVAVNA